MFSGNRLKCLVLPIHLCCGRGGPVVSALDSRFRGWWFDPGLCHHVVSLDKNCHYSTLSLFTQVYKWVPVIIMGGNLTFVRWTSIPSGGSSNIPSCFFLQKPELSTGIGGSLGSLTDFTFMLFTCVVIHLVLVRSAG